MSPLLILSYRSGLHRVSPPRSCVARFLRLICPLLTSPMRSTPIARCSANFSRTRDPKAHRRSPRVRPRSLSRVNAGFIKHTPIVDGGLHGHVPARPGCTTPHIRFLFVAPRFRIGLPSDLASQRRPCPSPCLRLRLHLARGLSPRKRYIMRGTHVTHETL